MDKHEFIAHYLAGGKFLIDGKTVKIKEMTYPSKLNEFGEIQAEDLKTKEVIKFEFGKFIKKSQTLTRETP